MSPPSARRAASYLCIELSTDELGVKDGVKLLQLILGPLKDLDAAALSIPTKQQAMASKAMTSKAATSWRWLLLAVAALCWIPPVISMEAAAASTAKGAWRLLLGFVEAQGNSSFRCSASRPCIPYQYSKKKTRRKSLCWNHTTMMEPMIRRLHQKKRRPARLLPRRAMALQPEMFKHIPAFARPRREISPYLIGRISRDSTCFWFLQSAARPGRRGAGRGDAGVCRCPWQSAAQAAHLARRHDWSRGMPVIRNSCRGAGEGGARLEPRDGGRSSLAWRRSRDAGERIVVLISGRIDDEQELLQRLSWVDAGERIPALISGGWIALVQIVRI